MEEWADALLSCGVAASFSTTALGNRNKRPVMIIQDEIRTIRVVRTIKPAGGTIRSGFALLATGLLLHLLAVFDLVDEDLGRLEARDVVLVNDNRSVAGYVAGDFLFALFIDETAETTYVDVMTVAHVGFHIGEKRLHGV